MWRTYSDKYIHKKIIVKPTGQQSKYNYQVNYSKREQKKKCLSALKVDGESKKTVSLQVINK